MVCPACGETNDGQQLESPYCDGRCARAYAAKRRRAGDDELPGKPSHMTTAQWGRILGGRDA